MKLFSLLLIITFSISITFAQKYLIEGTVTDNVSNPLPFANIRITGTTSGTSANSNGRYELKLKSGSYTLIASYIGYISDTLTINVSESKDNVNFRLRLTNINLPEITVLPGENPALEIIRKAILRKKERNSLLDSYEFKAYTKGIIKTQGDVSSGSHSVGINLAESDTVPFKISGILENQSEGFYKKPGEYKELIYSEETDGKFSPFNKYSYGGKVYSEFL